MYTHELFGFKDDSVKFADDSFEFTCDSFKFAAGFKGITFELKGITGEFDEIYADFKVASPASRASISSSMVSLVEFSMTPVRITLP